MDHRRTCWLPPIPASQRATREVGGEQPTPPSLASREVPNPACTHHLPNPACTQHLSNTARTWHNLQMPPAYTVENENQIVVTQVTQVVVIQQPLLRDVPGQMTCPYCQVLVLTEATHTPGLAAWLVFGVLCCFMCWPCSWIPFCVDSCKDVEHRCPNCRRVIYIHKRE
ncbi:lipopolysaccharide-induced tumor necrosis factor-alpha factor homolog isoform X3 [Oncorhynchus masou masou]|uniref:lipopolysaccharide-induced tumor necrosis factor-alpha factor homolog isoform X3 n=1 Tax=Oncorhynchus masou masou TaxID=90313 RepID=UPI003183CD10